MLKGILFHVIYCWVKAQCEFTSTFSNILSHKINFIYAYAYRHFNTCIAFIKFYQSKNELNS